jgi:hypothetical protein
LYNYYYDVENKKDEHLACMRAIRAYEILVGEPEGKRPLGGPQNI